MTRTASFSVAASTPSFDVPASSRIKVSLRGGGASGGPNDASASGNDGGATTFAGLVAPGGKAGGRGFTSFGKGGIGVLPTGGDVNVAGANGQDAPLSPNPSNGGNGGGVTPGAGGLNYDQDGAPGTTPGDGGGGGGGKNSGTQGGGGGGSQGSYLEKTFYGNVGLPTGVYYSLVVGVGGARAVGAYSSGGAGAPGLFSIEWDVADVVPGPMPNVYDYSYPVDATVPVTQGGVSDMRTMALLPLPNLLAGDVLNVVYSGEARNDAGYNVEFVTYLVMGPNDPGHSDYVPPGGVAFDTVGGDVVLNGSDVDPTIHYYAPGRSVWYVVKEDMPGANVYLRIRCRSTSATGSESCAIKQPNYNKLKAAIFRPLP